MSYYRHETAVVDDGAEIGEGCRVWHFAHISSGSHIGCDVVLGQNVYVGNGAIVGDRCKIQNNVSIYDGVILEEDVFCGPSMVFTNVINPRAAVERKHAFRPTRIARGATLGANCTILCGADVGAYAFVGAGAVVTNDVRDFALVVGIPARQIGWMSRHGERLGLIFGEDGESRCPATGELYVVEDGACRVVE